MIVGPVLFAGLVSLAVAQEQPPESTQPSDVLQTVVVTAEKRSENVLAIPAVVNVVESTTLEQARVTSLSDLSTLVPGLQIGSYAGAAQSFVSLRGISPQVFGDPTVVVFIDGFTANTNTTAALPLFDLERVEVLKGPQATLYGADALGGTINLISRKPTDHFEANLQTSYGEYGSVNLHAGLSGPLVPGLLDFRVSGGIDNHDGYWPNLVYPGTHPDDVKNADAHVALRFTPSDRFTSDLEYLYNRLREGCGDCVNPIPGYNPVPPTNLSSFHNFNDLEPVIDENIPGFEHRYVNTGIWTNTLKADAATVTAITGYSDIRFDEELDFDRGPGNSIPTLPGFLEPTDTRVFSQELRAASAGEGPYKWLVGGYYFNSKENGISDIYAPPSTFFLFDTYGSRTRNYALFGNMSYAFARSFEIQGGLRYDIEKKDGTDTFRPGETQVTSKELLPKVTLTHRLSDERNVYASVSRGYKAGGTNVYGPGTYGPEFLWTYEIGTKGESTDHRFAYELAAYYTDWSHQQVQEAEGFFTFIGNAGKTRVYGSEASGQFRPVEHLTVSADVSYNHARYVEFSDPTSEPLYYGFSSNLAGHKPALSPDWAASVSAQYVQPVSGNIDVTGWINVRYTGARSTDTDGFAQADGYTLVNASLGVGSDRLRLSVFAKNLFDQRYATYAALFAGVFPSAHLGAPRVAGVQIDARF